MMVKIYYLYFMITLSVFSITVTSFQAFAVEEIWEDYGTMGEMVKDIKNGDKDDDKVDYNKFKDSAVYKNANEDVRNCIDLANKVGEKLGDYEIVRCFENTNYFEEKYVDDEELWLKTEAEVRQALKSAKIEFVEAQDEAAFYGPKIDVEIFSVIGREFTLATNQLDFAVPKRFGLTYMDKDNQEKTPLCIHRAPLSTHERLIGFLLEHFAGAFPTWLAPVQVRVIGVSEKSADYAQKVTKELKQAGRRVELDLANESVGKKIRSAEMMKIPYMLVVGEKEAKAQSVSVRSYFSGDQGVMKLAKFAEKLATEVTARQLPPKQA